MERQPVKPVKPNETRVAVRKTTGKSVPVRKETTARKTVTRSKIALAVLLR
ncbi:MAG: hypothetical protein KBS45_02080 [Clostridiales bacterium]|nr:hypothetical protein [Candidatus Coliplasma caballi]